MACACCCVPRDLDPDPFDGREFLRRPVATTPPTGRCAARLQGLMRTLPHAASAGRLCSAAGEDDADDAPPTESQDPKLLADEPRNIVARGMRRFEIEKIAPPQPDWERLSPLVVSVLGQNPMGFTLNGTNCYIVGTGRRRILIDTGDRPVSMFSGEVILRYGNAKMMPVLRQVMREIGCDGFSHILITHLHHDHYGGVEAILDAFPGPTTVGMLAMPETNGSIFTLRQLKKRGLVPFLEQGPNPYNDPENPTPSMQPGSMGKGKKAKGEPPEWKRWRENWQKKLKDMVLPRWPDEDLSWDMYGRTKNQLQWEYWMMRRHTEWYFSWEAGEIPNTVLHDGDVLRTEGATLRVMHTPGHAENHAAFVLEEEGAVFSGDHVLGFGTTVLSDLRDYMASLARILSAVSVRAGRLYPGHGPHIEDGTGLLTRYTAHRQQREDQVVHFMEGAGEEPLRAIDIADALYLDTTEDKKPQARENVEKILLKLFYDGKLNCWEQPGVAAKMAASYYSSGPGGARPLSQDLRWSLGTPLPERQGEEEG